MLNSSLLLIIHNLLIIHYKKCEVYHLPLLSAPSLGLEPHPSGLPSTLPTYCQEYHLGIGITFIDMSVGNVKEAADRRGFDLTTPYRIFR